MNLSEKQKYIIIIVLSGLLVLAVALTIFAWFDYHKAVQQLSMKDSIDQEVYIDNPFNSAEFFEEKEHIVSDQTALNYFDDAVFVGDSRTEGLFLFSQISKETSATCYAWRGFTTSDIINKEKFNVDGKYLTGTQALENNKNFSKVFIMLGVNELCPAVDEKFIQRYDTIIKSALKANPDAVIVIQSIIPVAKWQSDSSQYINNANVKTFNHALEEYAQKNGYIWLDVGSLMADQNGDLSSDYDIGDGIHLNQTACDLWFDYLCYYTFL